MDSLDVGIIPPYFNFLFKEWLLESVVTMAGHRKRVTFVWEKHSGHWLWQGCEQCRLLQLPALYELLPLLHTALQDAECWVPLCIKFLSCLRNYAYSHLNHVGFKKMWEPKLSRTDSFAKEEEKIRTVQMPRRKWEPFQLFRKMWSAISL